MKIIIIEHEPFNDRKNDHYYIQKFKDRSISIEYWDLSKVLNYSKNINYNNEKPENYVLKFDNLNQFYGSLNEIDNLSTILIVELFFKLQTVEIFKKIKDLKIKWVRLDFYYNPTNIFEPSKKINDIIFKLLEIKKIKERYNNFLLKKWQHLNLPNRVFVTGNLKNYPLVPKENIIGLDYFDIKTYEEKKGISSLIGKKYIVFLDIMLPNHPDLQRSNLSSVKASTYFKKINYFFDKIEKETGYNVIIASHPKANYSNEFKNRVVLKNLTAELCINAEIILTHGSLSISFPLLAKKPIIYLYFEEMFKIPTLYYYYKRMLKASELLGAEIINIDKILFNNILDSKVDFLKYTELLEKVYLKDVLEFDNFEILLNSFNDLLFGEMDLAKN